MGLKFLTRKPRRRIFNPEVAPSHGDFPHLFSPALRDLNAAASDSVASVVRGALVVGIFAAALAVAWMFLSLYGMNLVHAPGVGG